MACASRAPTSSRASRRACASRRRRSTCRPGILEDRPVADVASVIMSDLAITERQKQALVQIYEAFREETARNAGRRGARGDVPRRTDDHVHVPFAEVATTATKTARRRRSSSADRHAAARNGSPNRPAGSSPHDQGGMTMATSTSTGTKRAPRARKAQTTRRPRPQGGPEGRREGRRPHEGSVTRGAARPPHAGVRVGGCRRAGLHHGPRGVRQGHQRRAQPPLSCRT